LTCRRGDLSSEKKADYCTNPHLWWTLDETPATLLLPQGVKPPRRSRRPRVRKGDVKACYVRIKRQWVRVGTLCLHCREFAPEL